MQGILAARWPHRQLKGAQHTSHVPSQATMSLLLGPLWLVAAGVAIPPGGNIGSPVIVLGGALVPAAVDISCATRSYARQGE